MRSLPLLLALLLPAGPAFAERVVEPTTSRDTTALADELGILHDQTSGLLILATQPYDHVLIGLEGADGTTRVVCSEAAEGAVALGAGCIRAVAHPIDPGHLDVTVSRGDDAWSGALLLVAGDVAVLDVEALLRLAALSKATEAPAFEFDILAFYDKLAAREDADKAGYCRRVLAGLPDGEDRGLVQEACDRAAERVAAKAPEPTEVDDDFEDDDLLVDDGLDTPAVDPNLPLLYHPDGRPRTVPRGTIPRRIATAVALGGVGASIGGALYWESEAERSYLDFRRAERVGDDPAMTQHLFFTKQRDRNRDVAIGVGVALTATAFSFLAHQLLERKAFQRAQEEAAAKSKLEGTE